MKAPIFDRVVKHEPGLYFYMIFPIAFAFFVTFGMARIVTYLAPWMTVSWTSAYRVHHFVYGFFFLAISGYLALIFNGPRAKFGIALLHGFGLGLAFDEFAFWLRLTDDDPARWEYDGLLLVTGVLLIILTARRGIAILRHLWPSKRSKNTPELSDKELYRESKEVFDDLTRKEQF